MCWKYLERYIRKREKNLNAPPLLAFPSEFRFNFYNYYFYVIYCDKFLPSLFLRAWFCRALRGFIFNGKWFLRSMCRFNFTNLNLTRKGMERSASSRRKHNSWLNYYSLFLFSLRKCFYIVFYLDSFLTGF